MSPLPCVCCASSPPGHDRLDIVDPARLAERCAVHWCQTGGAAAITERPIATELRVLWAVWSAAYPGLNVLLGYAPLTDACAALGTDHPYWVRLWHTLAAAYPGDQAPLQLGLAWIREPRHFAAPKWSVQWESLLDADWPRDSEGQAVGPFLIALGRDWLRGRESLPDWNYVWQRLVQSGKRLVPGWLAELLRQGVDWGVGREDVPGWTHVWERLIEHFEYLPADLSADLFLRGADWLRDREDAPEWPYVWQYLLDHRDALPSGIVVEDLFRAGVDWLRDREDMRGWSRVWQFLLAHRDALPSGIVVEDLFRAGVDWLRNREDTPGWPYVWQYLLDHRDALPSGIVVEDLFRAGVDWLRHREDMRGWSHVWQFLLEHRDGLPSGIVVEDLFHAGVDWLRDREKVAGWYSVWLFLLEHQDATKFIDSKELWQAGANWLRGREDASDWSSFWKLMLKRREDATNAIDAEKLWKDTATWAEANLEQPNVPDVIGKLLVFGVEGAGRLDGLAGWLARWFLTRDAEPARAGVLRHLIGRGVGNKQEEAAQPYGPGWTDLKRVLQTLTGIWRSFLDDHSVGEIVTGKIISRSKRGYNVNLDDGGGASAFLPRFNIEKRNAIMGASLQLEIIELDKEHLSIKVSHRARVDRALMETIAVGQVIEGSIADIGDYYLSVDIGGMEGRLHKVHLISWSTDALSSRFAIGQSILVQVKKLDLGNRRIQLAEALNPEQQRARRALLDDLIPGQVFRGTIAKIVDYGLFVDIGGIHGLLHRTKLIDSSEDNLKERFQRNQSILVEVDLVDVERQRIGLAEAVGPV